MAGAWKRMASRQKSVQFQESQTQLDPGGSSGVCSMPQSWSCFEAKTSVVSHHSSQSLRMSSVCGGGGKVGDVKLSTLRHFRVFLTAGAMATMSKAVFGKTQVWPVSTCHTETEGWIPRSRKGDRKANYNGDSVPCNILRKWKFINKLQGTRNWSSLPPLTHCFLEARLLGCWQWASLWSGLGWVPLPLGLLIQGARKGLLIGHPKSHDLLPLWISVLK